MGALRVAMAAVQGRVADRTAGCMIGAGLMAAALADQLRSTPAYFGTPDAARVSPWQEDLEAARPLLAQIAGFTDRALGTRQQPVLCLGCCGTSLATLPVVARHRPDATVLWCDAHGDFNTPATTTTGYLGGLPLAGACGYWATGFGSELRAERIVCLGSRDLDPPEVRLMGAAGVRVIPPGPESMSQVLTALGDGPVYIHVDWDVLDPIYFPTEYKVPGGLSPADLRAVLSAVVTGGREIIGLEVAEFEAPEEREAQQAAIQVALEVLAPVLGRLDTSA